MSKPRLSEYTLVRRGRSRLALEPLEDRTLLSAPQLLDLASYRLDPTGTYDASRILVKFRPEIASPDTASILPGTQLGRDLRVAPGLWEVMLPTHVTVSQALAAFRASSTVVYAEPNYGGQLQVIPNDTLWEQLYGLQRIQAPAAWDLWTGGPWTSVAVMDSGVSFDHPDLCRNIWLNNSEIPASRLAALTDVDGDGLITFWDLNDPVNQGEGKITDQNGDGRICGSDVLRLAYGSTGELGGFANGLDDDGDGFPDDLVGWNMFENTNNPVDMNGHGSHVSGTIGAVGNNGVGVVGVNWRTQIMPLKITIGSSGSISLAAAILGTYYAAYWGVPVSNNSWGGGPQNQAMRDAIAWARTQGHLFVAAAGNGGGDGIGDNNDLMPFYPASYGTTLDNVISVAATTSADTRAYFSNYGLNSVHLGAPGVSIMSTLPNNTYGSYNGTSMASPHVAGAAAYLKNLFWDKTYLQIKNALLNGVDNVGLNVRSRGRLNLYNSLQLLMAGSAPGGSPGAGRGDPTPGTLSDSANLIVDSLTVWSTPFVAPPRHFSIQIEQPVRPTVDLPATISRLVHEAPMLGDNEPILADRTELVFDWNFDAGL